MAFILVGTDACAVVALLMSAPFKVGDWVNVTGEKTTISRPLFINKRIILTKTGSGHTHENNSKKNTVYMNDAGGVLGQVVKIGFRTTHIRVKFDGQIVQVRAPDKTINCPIRCSPIKLSTVTDLRRPRGAGSKYDARGAEIAR